MAALFGICGLKFSHGKCIYCETIFIFKENASGTMIANYGRECLTSFFWFSVFCCLMHRWKLVCIYKMHINIHERKNCNGKNL